MLPGQYNQPTRKPEPTPQPGNRLPTSLSKPATTSANPPSQLKTGKGSRHHQQQEHPDAGKIGIDAPYGARTLISSLRDAAAKGKAIHEKVISKFLPQPAAWTDNSKLVSHRRSPERGQRSSVVPQSPLSSQAVGRRPILAGPDQ